MTLTVFTHPKTMIMGPAFLTLACLSCSARTEPPGAKSGPVDDTSEAGAPAAQSSAQQVDAAEVCDGSEGVRLRVLLTPGGEMTRDPSNVLTGGLQQRSAFLMVDGNCSFWAWGASLSDEMPNGWSAVRTGVLSDQELAQLTSDLGYSEWEKWDGDHSAAGGDRGSLIFSTLTRQVRCQGGCTGELEPLNFAAVDWIGSLYARATPLAGPVAASAMLPREDRTVPNVYVEAPEGWDVAALAESDYGLISDEGVLSWLREQREPIEDPRSPSAIGVIYDNQEYWVYFRDLTPFERVGGSLSLDRVDAAWQ